MKNKCLFCYKELNDGLDFHESCSQAFFGTKKPPHLPYSLDQMAELAKEVVEKSVSVPGIQPKLSMTLLKNVQKNADTRLTVIGALGGSYIFKPPLRNYGQMPENEHVTMHMAELFGIRVVPSSLIRLRSGELSYITKRIDRKPDGEKIHMIDMFQITEAFDKYKGSMEKIGNAIGHYSSNTMLDKLFFFEMAVFSFLTGNNDMHLKNFSMIESPSGWILSPAYDLLNVAIILPEDTEELALTLGGRKKRLKLADFKKFGSEMGLTQKQITGVFGRFSKNIPMAYDIIEKSFLSEENKIAYRVVFDTRMKQLQKNHENYI